VIMLLYLERPVVKMAVDVIARGMAARAMSSGGSGSGTCDCDHKVATDSDTEAMLDDTLSGTVDEESVSTDANTAAMINDVLGDL